MSSLVDLLDRNAGRDQPHAEQIGEGRAVGRIERREHALTRRRDRVLRARRVIEPFQPQRIVAEHMLATLDQADVRPVICDPDQLDAVAVVRLLRREALLDQRDRLVFGVVAQRVEIGGRQAGRAMWGVVVSEIGGGEGGEQHGRGQCRAVAAEAQHHDRHEREADASRDHGSDLRGADDSFGEPDRHGDDRHQMNPAISISMLDAAARR